MLRTISLGVGVQSTALVVDWAEGRLGHIDAALFANVGDDSEHPKTLAYFHDVLKPWGDARGLNIVELGRTRRDGAPETLYGRLTKPGSRSIGIPVRIGSTGAPGTRACTVDFKIKVVGRWLREHGASADNPAEVMIGISTDEIERVNSKRTEPYEIARYPHIEMGRNRAACAEVIRRAGLPIPPKSSCYFCPFHSIRAWSEMRRDEPELFDRAQALEDHLNGVRVTIGKDPVFFSRRLRRLSDAIQPAQDELPLDWGSAGPDDDRCDSGYCWT